MFHIIIIIIGKSFCAAFWKYHKIPLIYLRLQKEEEEKNATVPRQQNELCVCVWVCECENGVRGTLQLII